MKQTLSRYVTGILIIIIGLGALLDTLNVISFWGYFSTWWPALIIIGGVITFANDARRNYIWALALVIVGGLLLLKNHSLVEFSVFELIVPVVLVAVGLSVLIGHKNRSKVPTTTHHADDISVLFSGSETVNKSDDYQGGKVTAIFGGAMLDLRDAKIKKEATLDVFALFGGIEIRVPRDWKVVSKVAPIAGGVENKSQGDDSHKGPVLILTGSAILGGVEIKT
jgi:predicted membrane protein